MNKLNKIRHLFNTYSEIKVSANSLNIDGKTINKEDGRFSHKRIANTFLLWFNTLFFKEEQADALSKRASAIREKALGYISDINNRLNVSSAETKAAALADKSNLNFTQAFVYNPYEGRHDENTTATISDGKVIGLNTNDKNSLPEKINGSKIQLKNVQVYMLDGTYTHNCIVYDKDNNKLEQLDDVINVKRDLLFQGMSNSPSPKDIELKIDRYGYGVFNTIEIYTEIPYIYTVYTSDDGVVYNKINKEKILTRALNLPIENSTARYIKVVVHISRPEGNNGYGYIYNWKTNAIIVGMTRYESDSLFQSSEIKIRKNAELISIDTCDNYQNRNVSIKYYISINGQEFRHIKPLRKVSRSSIGTKSILSVDDFILNKVGDLTDYSMKDGKNIFNAEIYSAYMQSNIFRFFNRSEPFLDAGDYISVTGMVLKDKDIFAHETIFINEIPYSGSVKIHSGINTIKFPKNSFKELFNINNSNYKLDKNKYIITTSDSTIEIEDTNYLRNGFTLSHEIFDWILGTELKDDDINLISSVDTFKISTDSSVKRLNIAIRNRVSHIDNVRLRIEMKSLDKHTQPHVRRVIFKIA